MREILFRGKQIDTGAWVEGAFCMKDCDSFFGVLVDRPSIIKYEEPHSGYWFRVDPETVGQFTGVTDKNGKRIFEGDILEFRRGRSHIVKFADGGFIFEGTAIPVRYADKFEVIGNIHDNPELQEITTAAIAF